MPGDQCCISLLNIHINRSSENNLLLSCLQKLLRKGSCWCSSGEGSRMVLEEKVSSGNQDKLGGCII